MTRDMSKMTDAELQEYFEHHSSYEPNGYYWIKISARDTRELRDKFFAAVRQPNQSRQADEQI